MYQGFFVRMIVGALNKIRLKCLLNVSRKELLLLGNQSQIQGNVVGRVKSNVSGKYSGLSTLMIS